MLPTPYLAFWILAGGLFWIMLILGLSFLISVPEVMRAFWMGTVRLVDGAWEIIERMVYLGLGGMALFSIVMAALYILSGRLP